jgi:hypothetical protein
MIPLEERRARWAAIVEMTESASDEQLRAWLEAKSAEIRQRKRKAGLFLVPKPAPKPEQLDLDFDGESQREVERAIADVLERNRRPKVG